EAVPILRLAVLLENFGGRSLRYAVDERLAVRENSLRLHLYEELAVELARCRNSRRRIVRAQRTERDEAQENCFECSFCDQHVCADVRMDEPMEVIGAKRSTLSPCGPAQNRSTTKNRKST